MKEIEKGFKMVEDGTRNGGKDCITFKKRTNEINYVRIINDDGCFSNVTI